MQEIRFFSNLQFRIVNLLVLRFGRYTAWHQKVLGFGNCIIGDKVHEF